MVASGLRLRPLREDDERDAVAAHTELAPDDFDFLLDWSPDVPWAEHLQRHERERRGLDVPPGRVPATFLVAVVDDEIVGRVSIRHELNDDLLAYHGHIGYGVRPDHRRRGYATEMLRQSLLLARAEGVDRVLVTCDTGNDASALIIERAGGVLEDIRAGPDGIPKRRYWIG